jgi:hypothetical protein
VALWLQAHPGVSVIIRLPVWIISPKLQLLSGHRMEQNPAVYWALALADVAAEYEAAMRVFPVR